MKAEFFTPALTIFDHAGQIDYEGNRRLIKHLIDNNIDGIVPLGSTGEFTSLSYEEKKSFLDFYLSEVSGQVKVLPGTGCQRFDETVDLSNFALKKGAEAVLVIGQYYYGMTQADVFHYYDKLAKEIDGPMYLYNYPERTGMDFEPETVLKLVSSNANIVGMKESVGSFAHTRNIMACLQKDYPHFKMYSGFDDQFLDNIDYGGCGSIGAISNLLPDLCSSWVKAKNQDDFESIVKIKQKIHRLMPLYQIETNCSGLYKAILKARGLNISTVTQFPFESVSKASIDQALKLIESIMTD